LGLSRVLSRIGYRDRVGAVRHPRSKEDVRSFLGQHLEELRPPDFGNEAAIWEIEKKARQTTASLRGQRRARRRDATSPDNNASSDTDGFVQQPIEDTTDTTDAADATAPTSDFLSLSLDGTHDLGVGITPCDVDYLVELSDFTPLDAAGLDALYAGLSSDTGWLLDAFSSAGIAEDYNTSCAEQSAMGQGGPGPSVATFSPAGAEDTDHGSLAFSLEQWALV
jgi:hypothetical protein